MLQIPHDADAEKSVLGSMLYDPKIYHAVATLLVADDFYVPEHARIYDAIRQTMLDSSGALDSVSIRKVMGEEEFTKIGGDEFLTDLSACYVTGSAVEDHCAAVLEYATRRRLMVVCNEAIRECNSGERQSADVIENLVASISKLNRTRHESTAYKDLLVEAVDLLEKGYERADEETNLELVCPTGLDSLDSRLGVRGLPRGLMTVIAAESSMGKSALATCFARLTATKYKQRILICTFEDSSMSIVLRTIAQEVSIENSRLQRLRPTTDDMHKIGAAGNRLYNAEIRFMEPGDVDRCCMGILAENAKHRFDMVVVDYLQMVATNLRTSNRQEIVDYSCSRFNETARRMPNTATVLISQLRKIDGRRPSREDLYWSGQIGQVARTVILIWGPPELNQIGARNLIIDKQSNGQAGVDVLCGWRPESVLFHDLTDEEHSRAAERLAAARKAEKK